MTSGLSDVLLELIHKVIFR